MDIITGGAHGALQTVSTENKHTRATLTRPRDIENERVVTVAVHLLKSSLGVLAVVKRDKAETLGRARLAVAHNVCASQAAEAGKRFEQVAQVVVLCVDGKRRDTEGREVVAGTEHGLAGASGTAALSGGNVLATSGAGAAGGKTTSSTEAAGCALGSLLLEGGGGRVELAELLPVRTLGGEMRALTRTTDDGLADGGLGGVGGSGVGSGSSLGGGAVHGGELEVDVFTNDGCLTVGAGGLALVVAEPGWC